MLLLLLLVTNSYLGLDSIALCLSIHMYTAHCMYIVYILFFKSSERQRTTSWPIRMPSFIYLMSIPLKFPIWSMISISIYNIYPSQATTVCISGRSIFLCQAISKCSLVETAFLLLVTVSTVSLRCHNPTIIIKEPFISGDFGGKWILWRLTFLKGSHVL